MKKLVLFFALALTAGTCFAQLRITEVDPFNDSFVIKNFGTTTVDISSHQATARFGYSVLSGFGLLSGSMVLAPEAEAEFQGIGFLHDVASDLGLYIPGANFATAAHMIDFVEYGGGGEGRESVAHAKGIWTAGTFVTGPTPYYYACSGEQLGVSAWVASGTTITTQLEAGDCGATVATIGEYLRADVLSSVGRYKWEADNAGDIANAYSPLSNPGSRKMAMSFFSNVDYSTTFNVRVKAYRNGCWSDYGPVCTVTTPVAPSTQLIAADCGSTLADNFSYIHYEPVPGATRYRIWATDGASFSDTIVTPSYAPTIRKFYMNQFGAVANATTYQMRVAAMLNGVWQAFGPSCNLTTAAGPPTSELVPGDCGKTVGSNFEYLFYSGVPDATRYRIRAVGPGIGIDTIYTPQSNPTYKKFFMGQFAGVACGTTYDISVAVQVNGVWEAFGPVCTVTTAACKWQNGHLTATESPEGLSLVAFPNPSNGAISIALPGLQVGEHNIDLKVVDLTGRMVWNRRMLSTDGEIIAQVNTAADFAKGVYVLIARVDGQTYQQKLVVE